MGREAYLRIALSKYHYPEQTKEEVLAIFRSYGDLGQIVDNYVFDDGTTKDLLCLDGTIPVTHEGETYNIPIRIYLLDTHPYHPPIIFVKPTPSMEIKESRHVDMTGRVYLPYLHEWKHPSSDLMGVIQIMQIIFGEELPVFSKPPNSAATVAQIPIEIPKGYRYPDHTKQEVLEIRQSFSDLRPLIENFLFNDGTTKERLCLDGTIPVTFKGKSFNIPIRIYLPETHPYHPPAIFVRPTPSMQINQSRHVDMTGRVYLPYLNEWKHPMSDLMGVFQIMAITFGEEPPVFCKPPNSTTTGALTPHYRDSASGQLQPYATACCSRVGEEPPVSSEQKKSVVTVAQIIYSRSRKQMAVRMVSYSTAERSASDT